MPGNEVADKVHNFFERENLSQDQHQFQVASRNWAVLSNNPWTGSQWQIRTPLSSNPKNYNVHKSGFNIFDHFIGYLCLFLLLLLLLLFSSLLLFYFVRFFSVHLLTVQEFWCLQQTIWCYFLMFYFLIKNN